MRYRDSVSGLPKTPQRAHKKIAIACALLITGACAAAIAQPADVDAALPAYVASPVSLPVNASYVNHDGAIRIGGAEHVAYIVARFDALFAKTHPGVNFAESLRGTTTALPLLTAGQTLFAPVGRGINGMERIAYKRMVGGSPLEIRVAHASNDTSQHLATSLAVYVNRANPLATLPLSALSKVLSIGNQGGDFSKWGQLGLDGVWRERTIHVYGTPEYSGFGDYLQETHLHRQQLTPGTEHYGTTGQLLARLAQDPAGITVAAVNLDNADVKSIGLIDVAGNITRGTDAEVMADRYPLGRYLYFYLRREPGQAVDALTQEYMRLVLSREGQQIIASQDKGYLPLSASEAAAELAKLSQINSPAHAPREPGAEANASSNANAADSANALRVVGGNGMSEWQTGIEALYQRRYPHHAVTHFMVGSATAMPALIAGTADIAPMTRVAFGGELAGFKQMYRYAPEVFSVGYQGFTPRHKGNVPPAVYVNRRNPLAGVSMDTLGRILTSGSSNGDISRWSQLASATSASVPAECRNREIHLYGNRDDGGALTSLLKTKFGGNALAMRYEAFEKPSEVIAAVADDVCSIGLTGWADPSKWSAQVRVLALGRDETHFVEPTYQAVAAGAYPLSLNLLVYVNHVPGKPLPEAVKRYLSLALSDEGQAVMRRLKDNEAGFVPLSPADLARERAKLAKM